MSESTLSPEELAEAQHADDAGRTPQDWGRYRDLEKKFKAEQAKNAEMARTLAFRDAGINPADKDAPAHTQLFVDGYKGELTAEAITAEAIKMNILKAPEAAPDPTTDPAKKQAAEAAARVDAASNGAQPDAASTSVERVDQAFEEGGMEAMQAELRAQGIPTVHSP